MAWGRLALIEAAKEGSEVLSKVAQLHNYVSVEATSGEYQKPKNKEANQNIKEGGSTGEEKEDQKRPPAQFVYVKSMAQLDPEKQQSREYLNDPDQRLQDSDDAGTYQFDLPRQLLSSAQLVPFLYNSLSIKKEGKKIDQTILRQYLAQGKAIEKLPVKSVQRWPEQVEIIVDTGDHLRPYWKDFEDIISKIESVLGRECVRSYRMEVSTNKGKSLKCLTWPSTSKSQWEYWELPNSEIPVLILSDFGVSDRGGDSDLFWWRFAKKILKHDAPIITLSPSITSPQCLKTCSFASISPLRDAFSMPRHALVNGFKQQGLSVDGIKSILILLSPLPIVDVGLLRKLRDSFSWGASFIEGQLWNHKDVESGPLGMRVKTALAKQYAKLFRQQVTTTDADKLWEIVHEHHENAFQGLKQFENLNHALTQSVNSNQIQNYIRQLCATTSQSQKGSRKHSALEAQCRTYLAAQPDDIWVGEFGSLFYDLCAMAYESEIKEGKLLPFSGVHFQPERFKWLLDEKEQLDYELWEVEQISPDGEVKFNLANRSNNTITPVHGFEKLKKVPLTSTLSDGSTVQIKSGLSLLLNQKQSAIVTLEKHRFELAAMAKPGWANAIENKNGDLRASFEWSDQTIKCYWRFINGVGEWTVENPFGFDQYGLYADLEITPKIIQRFRWINPGTFQMGSPETEPERYDDEGLHEVTLSKGYWLADTTVTQEQWQAITRENPSHFKGESLPVESVSWNDSQRFIQQLNKRHETLTFQLPTEAQWEYACRAGTTTPFSFGQNVTPAEVNYNGVAPYNDGEKGENRNRTVPVKSLPANPWGLFEMHGNVEEWCRDQWQENLGKDPAIDPKYEQGGKGALRVIRGGSWIDFGRDVRSAYRDHDSPDLRNNDIGLRLSLGQPSGSSRGGSR